MKFFFSGISDSAAYKMLEAADVENILVDHSDARNVPFPRRIGILDSGAFRAFRQATEIDMHGYLSRVAALHDRCDLIVAPDVVGNEEKTFLNWLAVKDAPLIKDRLIPVWQYGTSIEHLQTYLSESRIVGIGGLAKTMREGETPEQISLREKTLDELNRLCVQYPNRFHIFGLNYLKGIERLRDICYSSDSSVWLRGASKSFVIFRNTKTGHLSQAPSKAIPQYRSFDREARCILSARNIEDFLSDSRPDVQEKLRSAA